MTDALSQHDIDRLLGDAGATLPPESAPRAVRDDGGDVHAYDFRRPHRISRERLRTLEAMYERLCKGLEAWVVSRVRGHVELRLQGLEQFSFGEFTQSLANPCATYAIDIADAGGAQGCVDVGQEFAYFLVDRLFGGGGAAGAPARALSPVERLAVRTVADKTAQLLEEIWADHVPLSLAVAGFESSPEILQVANRDDPMLVATIEVLAGQVSSLLVVCLPFGGAREVLPGLGAAPRQRGGGLRPRARGGAPARRARAARHVRGGERAPARVPPVAARPRRAARRTGGGHRQSRATPSCRCSSAATRAPRARWDASVAASPCACSTRSPARRRPTTTTPPDARPPCPPHSPPCPPCPPQSSTPSSPTASRSPRSATPTRPPSTTPPTSPPARCRSACSPTSPCRCRSSWGARA
jgi:flagellar motor switch protein FliM